MMSCEFGVHMNQAVCFRIETTNNPTKTCGFLKRDKIAGGFTPQSFEDTTSRLMNYSLMTLSDVCFLCFFGVGGAG